MKVEWQNILQNVLKHSFNRYVTPKTLMLQLCLVLCNKNNSVRSYRLLTLSEVIDSGHRYYTGYEHKAKYNQSQ